VGKCPLAPCPTTIRWFYSGTGWTEGSTQGLRLIAAIFLDTHFPSYADTKCGGSNTR
jgi:hypothetical protein